MLALYNGKAYKKILESTLRNEIKTVVWIQEKLKYTRPYFVGKTDYRKTEYKTNTKEFFRPRESIVSRNEMQKILEKIHIRQGKSKNWQTNIKTDGDI